MMKLEVHSKTDCPYCSKAKEFLKENGIEYAEFVYDDPVERNSMYDSLGLIGNQRSVPQIILISNGVRQRVGGYTDLIKSDIVSIFNVCKFNDNF